MKKSQAVPDTLQPAGISIALTIRSFDPALGLRCTGFWCFYTSSWISIAVAIRSLDPSLFPTKALQYEIVTEISTSAFA